MTAGNLVFVIIDGFQSEFHPGTLVRVRGQIAYRATLATSNNVLAKMMYVEVNDAQTMSGDHSAIDTHEEDIAQHIIWQHTYMQPSAADAGDQDAVTIEVDVRAKVKLSASGKMILALIIGGANNARTNVSVNLRALVMRA